MTLRVTQSSEWNSQENLFFALDPKGRSLKVKADGAEQQPASVAGISVKRPPLFSNMFSSLESRIFERSPLQKANFYQESGDITVFSHLKI
jgi:hypothetical protein